MNLLTPSQAAARLGLRPRVVLDWARNGRIPPEAWIQRPSGRYQFLEPHILALADKLRKDAEIPPVKPPIKPAKVPAELAARNNRGGRG